MSILRLTSLSVLALASTAVGQGGWIQLQPANSPPARGMSGFAAMALQNKTVLFGGEVSTPGAPLGDTWTWDGVDWQQITPAGGPPALQGVAMDYDLVRDRLVMFSGWNGGVYVPETWEFDGTNWALMTPAAQPPIRDWSDLAYDVARTESVLFGGHDWQFPGGRLADTWTWDGTNWTQQQVTGGPSARWGHAMTFDPNRGTVILFGGDDAAGLGNDMWEWDGSTWAQIIPATLPPSRRWHQLAVDPTTNNVLMVGGTWNGAPLNDTWEWDGTDWTLLSSGAGHPDGGYLHGLAFDPVLGRMLQFGGSDTPARGGSTNSTWMWVDNIAGFAAWTRYGEGCGAGDGSSFYELFDGANAFDLAAGTGWTMLPSGSSYVVLSGLNPLVVPSGAPLASADDQTQAVPLPFPFPLANGTIINEVYVCSNGFISLEPTTDNDFSESVGELLAGPMRVCPLWDDFNPAAGGTIHAEQDPANPALFHVTWTGVPEFNTTTSNDFQVSFEATGAIEVKYGAIAAMDGIVGYTSGGGVADPGSIDLGAALPNSFQLGNDLPALSLRNVGGGRPVLGTNYALEVANLPSTATAAALLISTTQLNPGVDLTPIGLTGCSLLVGSSLSAPLALSGGTASISLPLPSPSTLQGASVFVQGAVIGVTNVQPLPVGLTNGGVMLINVN